MRTPKEIEYAIKCAGDAIAGGERNGDPQGILNTLHKIREVLEWVRGDVNAFDDLIEDWTLIDKRNN